MGLTGLNSSWASGQDLKSLHSQWANLLLHNGLLYCRWERLCASGELMQLLVPRALRDCVLGFVHGHSGAGHFGVKKALRRLPCTTCVTFTAIHSFFTVVTFAWQIRALPSARVLRCRILGWGHLWPVKCWQTPKLDSAALWHSARESIYIYQGSQVFMFA